MEDAPDSRRARLSRCSQQVGKLCVAIDFSGNSVGKVLCRLFEIIGTLELNVSFQPVLTKEASLRVKIKAISPVFDFFYSLGLLQKLEIPDF